MPDIPNIKASVTNRGTAASGVNNDGTIIVGTIGQKSIYWEERSSPRSMGFLSNGTSATVEAVNATGSIAVGSGDTLGMLRAFRWRKGGTPEMEDLGFPDDYIGGAANGLNAAGNIIVGYGFYPRALNALRWTDTSGTLSIDVLQKPAVGADEDITECFAHATNDNGRTIVGDCKLRNLRDGRNYRHVVCWLDGTTTGTVLHCLGVGSDAWAYAVSGDGNVIVGASGHPDTPDIRHAVLWRRTPGTDTFNIENLNVSPEPSQTTYLAEAHGVSQDGTVIVGECLSGGIHGRGFTQKEAFIWREDTTPHVEKLADFTAGSKQSAAYDVIKKSDGAIIAVGGSKRNGREIAVRWNNLAIEDLNFPP